MVVLEDSLEEIVEPGSAVFGEHGYDTSVHWHPMDADGRYEVDWDRMIVTVTYADGEQRTAEKVLGEGYQWPFIAR